MTATTWGYRFLCPQCGFESVTQDEELRDSLIDWHEDRNHDGRAICEWDEESEIPVSQFPEDESPDLPSSGVSVTQRSLGVTADD